MRKESEILADIINYANMKSPNKMSFIACNNENVMDMLDFLINITKDR